MSSIAAHLPPDPSPEPIFRLSVQQYHAMIEAGVLTDDDPVELLEGILVFKVLKKPAHRLALRKLNKALEKLLSQGYFIQLQEPVTLATGEPEPDAAIVRGMDEDYATRHPGPADVALVIEVADTTHARDRGIKLRSYAGANIACYWIVDLVARQVEVYSEPKPDADPPTYSNLQKFDARTSVRVTLDGRIIGEMPVSSFIS